MVVKITAQLPFSWCQSCDRRELRTEKLIADGEVYDSQTICENAPICEACEEARRAEIDLDRCYLIKNWTGTKEANIVIRATEGPKQQRRQNNKSDTCLGSGHGETWMKCRLCGRSYEVQSEQIDKETGEKYCPWCEGYGKQEEK